MMELTAIYHRPESEYAYLYKEGQLHIRIRTKRLGKPTKFLEVFLESIVYYSRFNQLYIDGQG